ncbi:MAG TPA: metallophosphoesterase family protein [bacterium]|nr:metallophosphoesterase family protein [bacterium]
MIYGVLADTQTVLSPPEILALKKAFNGVDGILHAGPVGDLRVLEQLDKIAPTKAVCGNSEESYVRGDLYVRLAWRVGPVSVGLVHGYGKPHGLKKWLLKQFEEEPVQVVVYGRNFEPTARQLGGHYFFNPGSFLGNLPEGQHGQKGPRRVGLLFIHGRKVDGQAGIPLQV